MAFQDSNWPRDGELSFTSMSTKEKQVTWDIAEYLNVHGREHRLGEMGVKSANFTVAGGTWNFFISRYFVGKYGQLCRFGINVHTLNAQFDSCCSISFLTKDDHVLKTINFNLNCEKADAHWVENRILDHRECCEFFFEKKGQKIVCRISIKKSSNKRKRTCSLNEDANIQESKSGNKLGQDFKQLLLSGDYSDVTFQVGDQQFKAHRAILDARSSVFAAMFRHDMKEKATGVVNVEDCEPSSFPVLLEFLYSGSTEKLSVENMFSVYKAADKYSVLDLKDECAEFMEESLSVENFCEFAEQLLILQHLESNLLEVIRDFFVGNCKAITFTAKWRALIAEYPIQVNDILITALASVVHDH